MWSSDTKAQLHEALTAEGFDLDASHTQYLLYKGRLHAGNATIACEIHVKDPDFIDLPKLRVLDDWVADRSVAHFEGGGFYCYAQTGDNVFNKYDPRGAVRSCIDMMRAALTAHLEKDLADDIAAEFPQHWLSDTFFRAELTLSGDRKLQIADVENDGGRFAVVTEFGKKESCLGELQVKKAKPVLARLVECASALTFKAGQKQPRTLAELIDWANELGGNLGDRVARSFGYEGKNLIDTVFINGANALVAARIDLSNEPSALFKREKGFTRMLLIRKAHISIERIRTKPVSNDLIFTRNLAEKSMTLRGKKICLIGCGTIGGHLAKMLAQSGAGDENGLLSLIDNQILDAENVGRHFLGINRVGENKAKGCAAEIKRLYPQCNVRGVNVDARNALGDLVDFDLIIDATGEEALSVVTNEWLKREQEAGKSIAGLFVWLFGNAVAAQGLMIRNDEFACYRCLKPRHGDEWRYDPRRNADDLEQAPGTCGEAPYLPYGVGGSVIAAGLGVNMALDWAKGQYVPRLRTIRIDFGRTRQVNDVNAPKSAGCPLCGAMRSV